MFSVQQLGRFEERLSTRILDRFPEGNDSTLGPFSTVNPAIMAFTETPVLAPPFLNDSCAGCRSQYRSIRDQEDHTLCYQRSVSDEEARELAEECVQSTEHDRQYLESLLQTHGDIILSRWTKKSKEKRATLLSTAVPGVFGPWPEPEDISSQLSEPGPGQPGAQWLNIPELMDDRLKLPALLHLRTAYPASEWAVFDTQESHACWCYGSQPVLYNENCLWLTADKYGTLTQSEEIAMHVWAMAGFPRAWMMLQSQSRLMRVLRDVADAIIDGANGSGNTKWTAQVQAGFHRSGTDALFNPYINQAFAAPVRFDPAAMREKAEARLRMLEDELWLMQQDPVYLHHALESVKTSLAIETRDTNPQYQLIAIELMSDLTNQVMHWITVVDLIEFASDPPQPDQPGNIPNIAMMELARELHGRRKSKFLIARMLTGLRKRRDPPFHKNVPARKLALVLDMIRSTTDDDQDFQPASGAFAVLEQEMQNEPTARLLDKRMYDRLADLAITHELLTTCNWSQVAVRGVSDQQAEAFWREQMEISLKGRKVDGYRQLDERLGSTLMAFDKAFPRSEGVKDDAWVVQGEEARDKMALFWDAMRREVRRYEEEMGLSKRRIDAMIEIISADLEESYLAEVAAERRERENNMSASPGSKKTKGEGREKSITQSAPSLEKQVQTLDLESDSKDNKASAETEAIMVKHESLLFFHKMFPSNPSSKTSSESGVQWKHFVQAMADAGFVATLANGPMVSFRDSRGEVGRRDILFSRPHVGSVLEGFVLRGFGRRMRRWFGWGRERFRERRGR